MVVHKFLKIQRYGHFKTRSSHINYQQAHIVVNVIVFPPSTFPIPLPNPSINVPNFIEYQSVTLQGLKFVKLRGLIRYS